MGLSFGMAPTMLLAVGGIVLVAIIGLLVCSAKLGTYGSSPPLDGLSEHGEDPSG